MTTLNQLAKETKKLHKDTLTYINNLDKLHEQLNEQYKENMITHHAYDTQMEELKQKNTKNIKQQVKNIREQLDEVKETETSKLKENEIPVTQDILAELTLLAEVDPDKNTLKEYMEKYSKTPLALQKIQAIASKKNIVLVSEELTGEEQLNNHFKKIDDGLDYLDHLNVGRDTSVQGITREMVLNGHIEKLDAMEKEA